MPHLLWTIHNFTQVTFCLSIENIVQNQRQTIIPKQLFVYLEDKHKVDKHKNNLFDSLFSKKKKVKEYYHIKDIDRSRFNLLLSKYHVPVSKRKTYVP